MIRLAFLILLGLPNVVFGQVDVTFVGSSSPYESSWDGKLLALRKWRTAALATPSSELK